MTTKNVILITGTSSGFGREAVKQYAAAGYQVVATMRNPQKADPEFADLPNVTVKALDVSDTQNVQAVVDQTVAEFGQLDVLYNNAGYNEAGAFEEISDAGSRREMETNFWGPVNMIRAVLPVMRRQQRGHILNMSSMAIYVNLPTQAFYSASKSALTSLSMTLAKEVKVFGIQVTDVEPGGFNTNFEVNSQVPEQAMPEYRGVYEAMGKFAAGVYVQKGLGDLQRAVALIVKETLVADAPLHLVLGMQGYRDARDYLINLIKEYDADVNLTETTDPLPGSENVFKYAYDHAAPGKADELAQQLSTVVLNFQQTGKIEADQIQAAVKLVAPDFQADVSARFDQARSALG